MRQALEAMSTSRLLDRLRDWSLHHADEAMARADRVEPEAAIVDRERALHRWPVPADWLADPLPALPERMREVGGVAFSLTMPAWMAPDGSIWVLEPGGGDAGALEEVVLIGVGDRRAVDLHVGAVRHRPRAGVGPWDRVRLREPDQVLGRLGRSLDPLL